MAGLKPVHGGSTPPFLVSRSVLVQRQVLRMCGTEGGNRGVTLHL